VPGNAEVVKYLAVFLGDDPRRRIWSLNDENGSADK